MEHFKSLNLTTIMHFALIFLKLFLKPFHSSYTGSDKKKDGMKHDTRKTRLWCKEKGMRFFPFVRRNLSTRIL
jgi:hypothetical protein